MSIEGLFRKQIPPGLVWFISAVALAVCGNYLQARVHLNHDVSWIMHSARWLLKGREIGVDVLDPSPPMTWVLSLPAAVLANRGLMTEAAAIRVVYWCYFLISTGMMFAALSNVEALNKWAAVGWKASFLAIATLAPGFSFGQREFASVMFAMPYLALAVCRLERTRNTSALLAISVGFIAGIGFSIKPYFLMIPLLVESWLIIRLGWRSIIRLEGVVLVLTITIYVLFMSLVMPEYLSSTVPMVRSVYWAYDATDFAFVAARYKGVIQPIVYGSLIALTTRTWTRNHTVVILAGLGYTVSYFVQAKGFVYHAFPVLVCAFVFLGICIGTGLNRVWGSTLADRRAVRLVLTATVLVFTWLPVKQVHDAVLRWYVQYNIAWGPTGQFRQAVISAVNQFAPSNDSYFFAFSTHPFPGFPTASYTSAEWSGRAASQFIVPAYARRSELQDPERREKVERAALLQRQMVIQDFKLRPPAIVFVDQAKIRLGLQGKQFDDLGFYLEDSDFVKIWSAYVEREPIGNFRVFTRRDARPPNPVPVQ